MGKSTTTTKKTKTTPRPKNRSIATKKNIGIAKRRYNINTSNKDVDSTIQERVQQPILKADIIAHMNALARGRTQSSSSDAKRAWKTLGFRLVL
jgi:hypothetical protein